MIAEIRLPIIRCTTGIYLRWYFNGFHYFNFTSRYEVTMKTESMDTQVTKVFSVISKIERPTKLKSEYSYQVEVEGIPPGMIDGFNGLLMAEKVEQYEGAKWYEVDITRGEHAIKDEGAPGYKLSFEVTRKELPNTPAVFQKSQYLYIGDTLADMDDDEVIPINKQVNDIAEMQDRQSDYTAEFKIRKTRLMRELFELSGEVGANTTFPYETQNIKLVQDGIEIISVGYMILDKVDDQYYYVSVYSGNLNFFKELEDKKLSDLTLSSCNHTWNIVTQAGSHDGLRDYIYPLCEPSDDGGITPLTDNGSAVSIYGGYIWPFIKLKAIWDEIISNTGYVCSGDILTNDVFLKMFMPITNLKAPITKISSRLFSVVWNGRTDMNSSRNSLHRLSGMTVINGKDDLSWKLLTTYICFYTAIYKIRITMNVAWGDGLPNRCWIYKNNVESVELTDVWGADNGAIWEGEITATFPDQLTFYVGVIKAVEKYTINITDIVITGITLNTPVTVAINLPDISQTDFIKMVCNMFALIPDANYRDRKINFWNYGELYDNINKARDWSEYLSEREDETEFKYGEYAQNNYLKYAESEDVIKDNGRGILQIDDSTLPFKKDMIELPVSTCDEVKILTNVNVSRIAFNKIKDDGTYDEGNTIDPRVVYISQIPNTKTLTFSDRSSPVNTQSVTAPFKASSSEIALSSLVTNYAGLSRMLTKTNLRRAKFNLPVYEVAGFKYNIPIYLSQYKAYFYVNKINNYVPGKLCVIDLIKL